jgi:dienelactone hydrolase
MRLGFQARAAEDAWDRVFAFFGRHIEPSHTNGGALE